MSKFYICCISKLQFTVFMFFLVLSNISFSQPVLSLTPVITGLSAPIQLVNPGDGTNRIFIVQQGGTIVVYDQSYNSLGTFLTVAGISTGGERGLISMALSPDYSTNGFFYVYYTNTSGNLEIARYHISADPNVADASSKKVVLTIPHPTNSNHNGGTLNFGNDGNLYLSTGDGGGAGDAPNNAQTTTVLLGKILRITVNNSAISPFYSVPGDNPFGNEVWALGLRNPFRWSFDSQTHDMWIGDVGQDSWEEIDHTVSGTPGGVNYGWRCYEGNVVYDNSAGCSGTYTFPVYVYPTQNPSAAVTGGTVYRGTLPANTALQGYYIAADFYSGNLYKIRSDGTVFVQNAFQTGISDFGVAENGEIYTVSLTGGSISSLSVSSVLPLILSQFTAASHNNVVQLNWATSSEQDLEQFEVEYSTDGNHFTKAGIVPAKNSTSGATYEFDHTVTNDKLIYYRLRMVDIDGNYRYSNIITITINNLSTRFVYPSFVTGGTMNIFINEPFTSVELISLNGSIISKMDITGRIGHVAIPVYSTAGAYIVRLKNSTKTVSQKIIIQ